jgi:hypothetical protein
LAAPSKYLGNIGKKEFWLEGPRQNGRYAIYWRVPSTREAIRAAPGWKILDADYSQIEIKSMADCSRDTWLTNALNSDKDIHCFMTSDIEGIGYDIFYKAYKDESHPDHAQFVTLRSQTKNITFGVPCFQTRGYAIISIEEPG